MIFKSIKPAPLFEYEPRTCFNCDSECESDEKYADCVRCEHCKAEDLNHPDDRNEYLFERDLRNGVV